MADTTAWMPLYPANFLCDTMSLTASQTGHYATLMAYAWRSGGVPNDFDACRRISREMTPEDWQVIRTFFVVADPRTSEERLVLEWQEDERAKAVTKYNDKVASIERARKAKAERIRSDVNADVSPDVSPDVSVGANADARPQLQLQTQLQTQLQKQTQDNTTETPRGASVSAKAKPRRKRSVPKTKMITWSLEGGFQGITDMHMEAWRGLYPHVDIDAVIQEAHVCLLGNPQKRSRKYFFDWLGHWFKNRNYPAAHALSKRENCL
jgi:uncharacterized protein YdaU (DUF1376 family)